MMTMTPSPIFLLSLTSWSSSTSRPRCSSVKISNWHFYVNSKTISACDNYSESFRPVFLTSLRNLLLTMQVSKRQSGSPYKRGDDAGQASNATAVDQSTQQGLDHSQPFQQPVINHCTAPHWSTNGPPQAASRQTHAQQGSSMQAHSNAPRNLFGDAPAQARPQVQPKEQVPRAHWLPAQHQQAPAGLGRLQSSDPTSAAGQQVPQTGLRSAAPPRAQPTAAPGTAMRQPQADTVQDAGAAKSGALHQQRAAGLAAGGDAVRLPASEAGTASGMQLPAHSARAPVSSGAGLLQNARHVQQASRASPEPAPPQSSQLASNSLCTFLNLLHAAMLLGL